MARPLVGIIGNRYLIGDEYPAVATGTMNIEAISHVAGCMPLIVPSDPA
ncbi:MAG: gamma-glutamyl-gamma-aminobutyrate hydrolase family protein, partial [Alphaproteobacteria bacterium]